MKCEFWVCNNTSGHCKHRAPFKVVQKATTKLREHLKKCNPAAFMRICIEGGAEVDASGNLIQELSFKEMLPHHARFAIMIVREWDNLWKCRSPSRREWARSLKQGARLPHRETCLKLFNVIHGLMGIELDAAIAQTIALEV